MPGGSSDSLDYIYFLERIRIINIFAVEWSPVDAAIALNNRHVVKMTLESAQILCTAAAMNGTENTPYKPGFKHHPCVKWAAEKQENYEWLLIHAYHLAQEYTYRYGKTHKCQQIIEWCKQNANRPKLRYSSSPRIFALAMPDEYKCDDPIKSYRNYYLNEKSHFAEWTKREPPIWWR